MVKSISSHGVLTPIIVRPINDGSGRYEILSGHNRENCARAAGLSYVPAVVREDLTEDEALLIVMETNLISRAFSDLKHSERAAVLSVHYEAIKRIPGYRSDLIKEVEEITAAPLGQRLSTREKLSLQYGLSSTTFARYIRANKLILKLKDCLDSDTICLRASVSLSYLREEEQEIVGKLITDGLSVNIKKADTLRSESSKSKLSKERILTILLQEASSHVRTVRLSEELFGRYFSKEESKEEIEKIVHKALLQYFLGKEDSS